jgi:hypothetical protein
MRRPSSLRYALALACMLVWPATAAADPSDLYQEFIVTGAIACNHPKSDLKALIANAGLNQYGDPKVMMDLKLATQRALAAGCYRGGAAESSPTPTTTGATAAPGGSTTAPTSRTVATGAVPVAAASGTGTSVTAFAIAALLTLAGVAAYGIVIRRTFPRTS